MHRCYSARVYYLPIFNSGMECKEQTKGAVMGSPVNPIVANIYMEAFEDRAINTALNPQRMWRRYMDNIFVIQKK